MTVKGRQVKRYYALLLRLGYGEVFEAANEAARAPIPTGPTKPGEMPSGGLAHGPTTVKLDLDFAQIFRACAGLDDSGELNPLDALAGAVLDLDDDVAVAGDWDAAEVAERYGPFVEASSALLKALMRPQFGPA